jgi:hypothetical protein
VRKLRHCARADRQQFLYDNARGRGRDRDEIDLQRRRFRNVNLLQAKAREIPPARLHRSVGDDDQVAFDDRRGRAVDSVDRFRAIAERRERAPKSGGEKENRRLRAHCLCLHV